MKRAAIYCRVSTADQKNNYSLPEQERECRKECQVMGFQVIEQHVYHEDASGDLFWERPLLQRMLKAARKGDIDVIVTYMVSRLSRRRIHFAAIRHEMDGFGVEVRIVKREPGEEIEGPLGEFFAETRAFVAELERQDIKERMAMGKRGRLHDGRLLGRPYPIYGYLWADETKRDSYKLDPETAPVVERLFQLVASGVSIHKVIYLFAKEGIPTPSAVLAKRGLWAPNRHFSHLWGRPTITRFIHYPGYWGEQTENSIKTDYKRVRNPETGILEQRKYTTKRDPADEKLVVMSPEICPPIVSKELALAAQDRLKANKREAGKDGPASRAFYLRGGFLKCGYCGHAMYAQWHISRNPRYLCNNAPKKYEIELGGEHDCPAPTRFSITGYLIERWVWEDIVAILTQPHFLERNLEKHEGEQEERRREYGQRLKVLREVLEKKEAARKAIILTLSEQADEEVRSMISQQIKDLSSQITDLRAEIEQIEEALAAEFDKATIVQQVMRLGDTLKETLESATIEDKRILLSWLGISVRVWGVEHTPRYEIIFGWNGPKASRPLAFENAGSNSHLPGPPTSAP